MTEPDPEDKLRIVFMCTGNQARSVIAEHYFRKITDGLPIEVRSAGTMDLAGAPALPEAVEAAASMALDLSEHKSRPYTAVDLSLVDVVIGFEQHHVATAVVEGNVPADKTFKLLELVRLLNEVGARPGSDSPVEHAKGALAAAAESRAVARSFVPDEDLADPVGRKPAFFRETAAAIQRSCDVIATQLFHPRVPSEPRPADKGRPRLDARIWD